MVEADVGDDAYIRMDDVGAIQPSASPDFDDRYVYRLPGEIMKSHGGGQLEKRRMQRFEEMTVFFHETDDEFFWYGHAVYPDSFAEIR